MIYHYHLGLGLAYSSYCEQYDQNHDPFKDDGKHKFTLDYAITRFMNTISNPAYTKTSSAESQALASLVNGTFAHTPQSVTALVAAGETEHKIQPGAHAGNSRTFTTTCKHCSHCRKDYHDDSECIALHPYLKKKGENGGRSGGNAGGRGRGGRGGKGGRGGNNKNNNNNPPKDEPKPADAEAAAAFSFYGLCRTASFCSDVSRYEFLVASEPDFSAKDNGVNLIDLYSRCSLSAVVY